ncbi:hypothetical protein LCGC14_0815370 [marine sediment metagenome]|uniref:Uncharacterized protein n=1 Tax=marine sediment metagenome TaxID=412755 RepID=A0A0F9PKH1_9ZZZZ
MPHIKLGGYDVRECLCCGEWATPGGWHCTCAVTPQWYQNSHGETACELHMREKFSVKSLADIKRERELAQADPSLAHKQASDPHPFGAPI